MRLLQLSVPDDQRDAVVESLRDRDLGYTETEGAGEQSDRTVVTVAVPADAVEYVLAELEEQGFDRDEFTVSVQAEFASFEGVDEVQNRWRSTPNRLAPRTLRSKAKGLRQNGRSFVWMMLLSAVVAVAGLLLGSPAVVVGSMVIAPIVSPVLTASVGAVRNDRDMIVESVHMQAYGLATAIATAAAFAWVVKALDVVPTGLALEQMELLSLRMSPSILAISIGLAAGAAGAYGLATKGRATIVGVMIAAALIPTAATVGIGIAWANVVVAVGSLLLLVLSMITINVGAVLMLLYLNYRPDDVDESILDFGDARTAAVVILTLLFVVATVGVTGGLVYQQSSFERSANAAIADVLDEEEYRELEVQSTTIEYRTPALSDRTVVTVALVRTTGEEYPELVPALKRSIAERTGFEQDDLIVQVRYEDYDRS